MAVGMGMAASADLDARLAALRAVIAEAVASKAPRRTVACLGAAVASALFGAAPPRASSAGPAELGVEVATAAATGRRSRRGRRAAKVKKSMVGMDELAVLASFVPAVALEEPFEVMEVEVPLDEQLAAIVVADGDARRLVVEGGASDAVLRIFDGRVSARMCALVGDTWPGPAVGSVAETELELEEIVHVPLVSVHEKWLLEKREQLASMAKPRRA